MAETESDEESWSEAWDDQQVVLTRSPSKQAIGKDVSVNNVTERSNKVITENTTIESNQVLEILFNRLDFFLPCGLSCVIGPESTIKCYAQPRRIQLYNVIVKFRVIRSENYVVVTFCL